MQPRDKISEKKPKSLAPLFFSSVLFGALLFGYWSYIRVLAGLSMENGAEDASVNWIYWMILFVVLLGLFLAGSFFFLSRFSESLDSRRKTLKVTIPILYFLVVVIALLKFHQLLIPEEHLLSFIIALYFIPFFLSLFSVVYFFRRWHNL